MPSDLDREVIERIRDDLRDRVLFGGADSAKVGGPLLSRLLDAAEAYLDEPARLAAAKAEGVREGIEMAAREADGWYPRGEEIAGAIRRLSPPAGRVTRLMKHPMPIDVWKEDHATMENLRWRFSWIDERQEDNDTDGSSEFKIIEKYINDLEKENAELRNALSRAAEQFEFYRGQHLAKGTAESKEKAHINGEMASMCRSFLAKK